MRHERGRLSALQVAAELGVTPATLYAYASRGLLHSQPVPGSPRQRSYDWEDVERLKQRKQARRDPAGAAARGLDWGSPVCESALTLIHGGKLFYRGRDAIELAREASLEQVAELLWAVEPAEKPRPFGLSSPLSPAQLAGLRAAGADPVTLLQAALPLAAAADFAAHDLRPAAVRRAGARILQLFTTLIAGPRPGTPIHRALQAKWAPRNAAVAEVVRAALVLSADHELNVSTFTARCAASAGASPYHVVAAAMATLRGYKHGGAAERVAALLAEIGDPRRSRSVIAGRLRRGERIPGFGHPLYPDGDPRARMLLRLAEAGGNQAQWRMLRAASKSGAALLREHPNLDFGLAAIARCYRLPANAPIILFALGRTVGWIGHAIEQYAADKLIRPRARYIGPVPEPVASHPGAL